MAKTTLPARRQETIPVRSVSGRGTASGRHSLCCPSLCCCVLCGDVCRSFESRLHLLKVRGAGPTLFEKGRDAFTRSKWVLMPLVSKLISFPLWSQFATKKACVGCFVRRFRWAGKHPSCMRTQMPASSSLCMLLS